MSLFSEADNAIVTLNTFPLSLTTDPLPGPLGTLTPVTSSTDISTVTSTSSDSPFTKVAPSPNTQTQASSHITTSVKTISNTPFFQNEGAVAGVATAAALVALLLLVCCICVIRWRRERARDRQMASASFIPVSFPPRRLPSVDLSAEPSGRNSAHSAYSAASSYGALTQPPLATSSQQPNYGFTAQEEPTPREYTTMGAVGIGAGRRPARSVQAQRARVLHTQTQVSLSGDVHLGEGLAPPQPQARDYLMNDTSRTSPEPVHTSPTREMPLSPTPLPNPFDGEEEQEKRALQVADANLPMPPRPLPNPFAGEEEQQNRLLEVTNPRPTSDLPLSPTPLPNPFSSEQGQKKRGFKVVNP